MEKVFNMSKSIERKQLVDFLDRTLQPKFFKDYCPNGLQVAGSETISRIVTGVTASEALIDRAIVFKADTLLVHHGYFWKGEDPCLVGIKGNRIKKLLQNNMNLLAYHLPLDAHPEYGNNVQLARDIDLQVTGGMQPIDNPIGIVGYFNQKMSLQALSDLLEKKLARKPLCVGELEKPIKTMALCTGAAQSMISDAASLGVDCYLTGEIAEQTVHIARETGVAFIAAGHHATERYGVKALANLIKATWPLEVAFIDDNNPV